MTTTTTLADLTAWLASDEAALALIGPARSGKTSAINDLRNLAGVTPIEARQLGTRFGLAPALGAEEVVLIESERFNAAATTALWALQSGDCIQVEQPRQAPTATILAKRVVIVANAEPTFAGPFAAMVDNMRRIYVG